MQSETQTSWYSFSAFLIKPPYMQKNCQNQAWSSLQFAKLFLVAQLGDHLPIKLRLQWSWIFKKDSDFFFLACYGKKSLTAPTD